MTEFVIGLASWVMGDGNYSDFKTGETRRFALETGHIDHLKSAQLDASLYCVPLGDLLYDVVGEVIHVAALEEYQATLLDFGLVRAYTYYLTPPSVGDRLAGQISLHVDPFFYMDEIAKAEGVPPLIHTWRIEKIELDVSPMEWVHRDDPRVLLQHGAIALGGRQPKFRVQVDEDDQWRDIDQTSWDDDADELIHGGYRLTCSLLPESPTHAL